MDVERLRMPRGLHTQLPLHVNVPPETPRIANEKTLPENDWISVLVSPHSLSAWGWGTSDGRQGFTLYFMWSGNMAPNLCHWAEPQVAPPTHPMPWASYFTS